MSGRSDTYYAVAPLPNTNARQHTQQIRTSSTSLLVTDSEDRDATVNDSRLVSSNPYDYTITKSESIMNGFFTRIGVTEVVFPWVIPNINPKTNRITVNVQVGANPAVSRTLVINQGFNKPSEIATAMQAGIRALWNDVATMAGFTMVYGTVPIVGVGNSIVPIFAYATNDITTLISFTPVAYNTPTYNFPPSTRQLFDILGFSLSNAATGYAGNEVLTTGNIGGYTYCVPIRYVDVICTQLTYNQSLKDAMSQTVVNDTLCRIYVTVPGTTQSTVSCADPTFCPPGCAPTVLYRDFASPKQIQWIPNQPVPGYLKISVLDDTGSPLGTSDPFSGPGKTLNKTDWSLTLQVTEN